MYLYERSGRGRKHGRHNVWPQFLMLLESRNENYSKRYGKRAMLVGFARFKYVAALCSIPVLFAAHHTCLMPGLG